MKNVEQKYARQQLRCKVKQKQTYRTSSENLMTIRQPDEEIICIKILQQYTQLRHQLFRNRTKRKGDANRKGGGNNFNQLFQNVNKLFSQKHSNLFNPYCILQLSLLHSSTSLQRNDLVSVPAALLR